MAAYYSSPRWSGEILDCSMPLTFDQYNRCSFDCLYCFSFFQRALSKYDSRTKDKRLYTEKPVQWVNPQTVINLFSGERREEFSTYIKRGITFQWGGLSDPFDRFEKQHGIGLEIMTALHAQRYPICFSTKGVWWVQDDRYRRLFRGNDFWNVKVSIINLDTDRAKWMERGVPSPKERLEMIRELVKLQGPGGAGVTLRLRPFIIGYSDINDEYLELIRLAGEAGATAISTEFLCLESRTTPESAKRFEAMSDIMGVDLMDFYKRNTVNAQGYLRLNWKIKKPFVDRMEHAAQSAGMRFYVSDSHHKDRSCNGSCCGLGEQWNYHRGQFTEALVIAKREGSVSWAQLEAGMLPEFDEISIVKAHGLNIARGTPEDRARFRNWSIKDYIKYIWNTPNHPRSPYKYFYGLLRPEKELDPDGNVIYAYQPYGGDK